MKYYVFPCGCKFPIIDEKTNRIEFQAKLEDIPLDCNRTWDLISDGNTKGVFQLESRLGQMLAKKLKPRSIEHLSALISIMRPGCISSDVDIITNIYTRDRNNTNHYVRKPIKQLFDNKRFYKTIISFDEINRCFVKNNLKDVIYNGVRETFKVMVKIDSRNRISSYYNLECTDDHPLLTNKGWKQLKDIIPGERIVVMKHQGSQISRKYITGKSDFRNICFKNYLNKCLFCDWKDGSLDVNHISGNRYTNNHADNLHYVCPNHHRMISENNIDADMIISAQLTHKLPELSSDFIWGEYLGKEYVKDTDVFDIQMEAPHHNFIAGNVVVHNCLEAIRDGKSVTEHYIDRKNGQEPVDIFHPSLEPALGATYGEMIYQEQAMRIAQDVAGFDLQQADVLRKAIGKKKPEIMAKVKLEFISGVEKTGVMTAEQAELVFGWIEKSQRYSFNKSHAVSYAIDGYLTAYTKAHFPRSFFTSYLYFAKEKTKPQIEIKELSNNAKMMDIEVYPPDFRHLNKNFKLINKNVYFGFSDIKNVGDSVIKRLLDKTKSIEEKLGKKHGEWTWSDILIYLSPYVNSSAFTSIITAGGFSYLKVSRNKMLFDYQTYSELSKREQEWCERNVAGEKTLGGILRKLLDAGSGKDAGCSNKNRLSKIEGLLRTTNNPPTSLDDNPGWIAMVEKRVLGLAITCNEVDACNSDAANCTVRDFVGGSTGVGGVLMIACKIDEVKEILTKNGKNPGQKMAFFTISDSSGIFDGCTVFPKQYAEFKTLLTPDNIVLLHGSRDKGRGGLLVNKVWQL